MITLLSVNWGDVWAMAGIGFGVVFIVLLLLVFVMFLLGYTVQKLEKPGTKKVTVAPATVAASTPAPAATKAVPASEASDADKAAIAMALYLHFFNNVHDEESHVITIHHNEHSAWHHELNEHVLPQH